MCFLGGGGARIFFNITKISLGLQGLQTTTKAYTAMPIVHHNYKFCTGLRLPLFRDYWVPYFRGLSGRGVRLTTDLHLPL